VRTIPYVVCDVFTDEPLTGNQLGVFVEGEGIDDETMQALAREMNYSESTFVLPATAGGDARIRIFTPTRELPFAGHPTLGTAFVVAEMRALQTVRLETGRGIVPVRIERKGPALAFGWMTQPIPKVAEYERTDALCAALGVPRSHSPVELYDNGMRYLYVELGSPDEVARVAPDFARLVTLTREADAGVNTFAGAGARWKTRMFAPSHGVNEDPATGSAAGPLALHLARHGRIRFGDEIVIDQGAEIGRPSQLHARVDGSPERVEKVEVGGHVVRVARGAFDLP
jgi:trans-2,3-dihydro-3-hydroxyanthranilate isomerase